MTIEERITERFIQKLEADGAVPPEVARRLQTLWKRGKLKDVDAILEAIQQGAGSDGQNSAP